MSRLLKFLWRKWYFLIIIAAAIITQCYLQLLLPEYMGGIQKIITDEKILAAGNVTNQILMQGLWMILVSLGVVCLAFIQFYSASHVSAYVGKELREEMYKKVHSISLTDYNSFGTGTLITRTTNDIELIKNFILMAIRILVMSPTMMIIAIIKTSLIRPSLLWILGVALLIIVVIMAILFIFVSPIFKRIQEKVDNTTVILRENLTGIRVIRAYNQESNEDKKFDEANRDLTDTFIKVNRILSISNPLVMIVFNLAFIIIYAVGFSLLDGMVVSPLEIENTIHEIMGDVSVVGQYSLQIMMSFVMFAMIFIMMPQAVASAKRINEVLDIDTNKDDEDSFNKDQNYILYKETLDKLYKQEKEELQGPISNFEKTCKTKFKYELLKFKLSQMSEKDATHSPIKEIIDTYDKIHFKYHMERKKVRKMYKEYASNLKQSDNNVELKEGSTIKGVIEFKDVSFTYPNSEKPCIEHISFKTKPGTTTAIIGSTGSGKSTLINLIPKFYKVTDGEILVDGTNINNLNIEDLRNKLGFVPQTALLFKGTIKSNMQFANKDATDEKINEALEIAQAKTFVSKLDKGLDSFVSQSGKNFSGGQRQRLCIARALVKDAEIYIFDDSFSALDFKTDAKLRAALKGYTKNSSVIVVAQRVSSILDADNILVLHEGKLVGQGTHVELIKNCKVYQDIVSSQLDKEEVEKTLKLAKEAALEGGN